MLNKILFIFITALTLWACKKDEDRVVVQTGTPSTLTASATSVVLTEAEATKDAVSFSWSPSEFGYDAAVDYFIEFGKKDSNFVNAKSISLGSNKTVKYTVAALNTIATEMKLTPFQSNPLEVRVKAQLSSTYPPVYSNVMNLSVTPYLTEPPYATVYLVGDATEFAWDNTKATPIFRDEADPFVYTFTGKLNAGNIKFLGVLGKWAPQWGTNSSGSLVFRETETDADPGSIAIATAGYYTVKLDLRNNVFSVAPYTATIPNPFSTPDAPVGIIGAFNNWSDIVPMRQSAVDPHYWDLATYTFSNDTELKFRIASGWSVNWGAENDASAEKVYGKGKQDGPNIKVKAGTYRILFSDLGTGRYIFIKQ